MATLFSVKHWEILTWHNSQTLVMVDQFSCAAFIKGKIIQWQNVDTTVQTSSTFLFKNQSAHVVGQIQWSPACACHHSMVGCWCTCNHTTRRCSLSLGWSVVASDLGLWFCGLHHRKAERWRLDEGICRRCTKDMGDTRGNQTWFYLFLAVATGAPRVTLATY